ncbi:hypothetical protein [Caloranaerobacter ferrireducens]|uniref:hypothetical protein n=1 Tax=Caloranaerobacter ferrireducens TaxID=1323370 RepID=UPI00084D42D8|nr:hypothetical protein [Caloranaerobacter ferrireducens]
MEFFAGILKVAFIMVIPLILKSMSDKEKINRERKNNRGYYENQIPKRNIQHDTQTIHEEYIEMNEIEYIDFANEEYSEAIQKTETYVEEIKKKDKEKLEKKIDDIIKQNEINDKPVFTIDFNSDDIVKGIIMSEILSKPKSLR